MRMREARLRRALRRIVLAALACPLGAAACHAASEGAHDASTNEPDAASDEDARDPFVDARDEASPITDAGFDAAACATYSVDGASIEGPTDGCADFRLLPCGVPPDAKVEDCFLDLITCAEACGTNLIYYCRLTPPSCFVEGGLRDGAAPIVDCVSCAGPGGRRPRGLREARRALHAERAPLGDYFAAMAHLESASVRAFRDLERWLTSLGAPPRLAREARRAAADERRHARAASRLARRFGGVTARPRVRHTSEPTLLELLEDDAIEGCVGETFGALVATWKAERASDPRIRRTLRRISADETRHAAPSRRERHRPRPRGSRETSRNPGRSRDRAHRRPSRASRRDGARRGARDARTRGCARMRAPLSAAFSRAHEPCER